MTNAITTGVQTMLKPLISFEQLTALQMIVAKVESVAPLKGARNPAYLMKLECGTTLGQKISIGQLPHNYTERELFGRTVLGIANFAPRRMAGKNSEVLTTGFPDSEGHVLLLNTRGRDIAPGTLVLPKWSGTYPLEYKAFEAVQIIAGTVIEMKKVQEAFCDQYYYSVSIDCGDSFGVARTTLDLSESVAHGVLNTQIAVVVNLKVECVGDPNPNWYPLSISAGKEGVVPLGIDKPVANGCALF